MRYHYIPTRMTKIKVTTLKVRMWSNQCCHTLLIEKEKWGIALANLQIIKFIHFKYAVQWILVNGYSLETSNTIKIHNISITLIPIYISPFSLPSAPGNHRSFCQYSFAFSRISYKWIKTLFSVLCLASFT